MCIRDRGGSTKSSWYGDCLPTRDFPLLIDMHLSGRIDLGTVSYTHLRAHETVLDIVCRLLLEKKNNQVPHFLFSVQALT